MLLLLAPFAFTGVELAFYESVYPSAIGFTQRLGENSKQLIGMNAIAQGVGIALGRRLKESLFKNIRVCRQPLRYALQRPIFVAAARAAHSGGRGARIARVRRYLGQFSWRRAAAIHKCERRSFRTAKVGDAYKPAARSTASNFRLWIAMLCSFVIGFADACWNTQVVATGDENVD